jgi:hypothetical protein
MPRKVKRKVAKLSKAEERAEMARKRQKGEMRRETMQAHPGSTRAWTTPPVIHSSRKRNRSEQRRKALKEYQ